MSAACLHRSTPAINVQKLGSRNSRAVLKPIDACKKAVSSSKPTTAKAPAAAPKPRVAAPKAAPKPGEPIGMTRAKQWSAEVEEAFRLQEAGYRGLPELLALGLPEPERWEDTGFIRKLQTKYSFDMGERVLLYFRRAPECEPRYLNRVKIYRFAA